MANQIKKYKLVYPFDIKEMKKTIVDEEYLERNCAFCYRGSAAKTYLDNRDIRMFDELTAEERRSFFSKSFGIVFFMYFFTTGAVIATEDLFIEEEYMNMMGYYVTNNWSWIVFLILLLAFTLSFLMICVKFLQRPPYNMIFCVLETINKSSLLCVLMIVYNTRILIVYSITFTIFSLFCILIGESAIDYKKYTHILMLACVEFFISTVIGVLTFSITQLTLDLAVLGVAVLICFIDFMILLIQMTLIIYGASRELTKYEYVTGGFLLYYPFMNMLMSMMRMYNIYFNVIKVHNETPIGQTRSKRIYVWMYR